MDQNRCPFCHLERSRIALENEAARAFPDAFPVAEGHTLVVPKRHVASLFDLSEAEQAALWRLTEGRFLCFKSTGRYDSPFVPDEEDGTETVLVGKWYESEQVAEWLKLHSEKGGRLIQHSCEGDGYSGPRKLDHRLS
jgi:hypothetical protein